MGGQRKPIRCRTARFTGQCPACGSPIRHGQRITSENRKPWVHESCFLAAKRVAEPTPVFIAAPGTEVPDRAEWLDPDQPPPGWTLIGYTDPAALAATITLGANRDVHLGPGRLFAAADRPLRGTATGANAQAVIDAIGGDPDA